jgi:hypothetical protein
VQKKYQIFISSTYEDLKEYREAIIKSCLQMGHVPVGMEMLNPADEEQWQLIMRTIDSCDYYCVIVAQRYGSTLDGISYTEREYDFAMTVGVPALRFLLDDNASWRSSLVEREEAGRQALDRFKAKLKQRMVAFWSSKEELQYKFTAALPQAIIIHPRPGWIRVADQGYEEALAEVARLSKENARLREELQVLSASSAEERNDQSLIDEMENSSFELHLVSIKNGNSDVEERKLSDLFLSAVDAFARGGTVLTVQISIGYAESKVARESYRIRNVEELIGRLVVFRLVDLNISNATNPLHSGTEIVRLYTLTDMGKRVARKIIEWRRKERQS